MLSSIPQIRFLPEPGVEGAAFKKQRLEVNDELDTRVLVDMDVHIDREEENTTNAPVRMDLSILGGANSTSKKKKKNPPIPCSSADVVYKEIRTLLGEAVVDRARSWSPYSYGGETGES